MNVKGLYGKFYVSRVDGRDQSGGDKEGAKYFVLDYVNDPFARESLLVYAWNCADEYPELAQDIREEISKHDTDSD